MMGCTPEVTNTEDSQGNESIREHNDEQSQDMMCQAPLIIDSSDLAYAVFRLTDVFALPCSRPDFRPAADSLPVCILPFRP